MDYLQIISVPIIATIVYWTVNLIKHATNNSEKFKRFIPLISAGLGATLGIICFYSIPDIIPASNALVVSGGASGLSATGCNQIIKQLKDDKGDNE